MARQTKPHICKTCGCQLDENNWSTIARKVSRYSCNPCYNKHNYAVRKANPRAAFNGNSTRRLITYDGYLELLNVQGGVCAICSKEDKSRTRLSVDHNHTTNKVRGLLCIRCNAGIGQLNDDPVLVEKALMYLRKYEDAAA